jgi:hypothetical protein
LCLLTFSWLYAWQNLAVCCVMSPLSCLLLTPSTGLPHSCPSEDSYGGILVIWPVLKTHHMDPCLCTIMSSGWAGLPPALCPAAGEENSVVASDPPVLLLFPHGGGPWSHRHPLLLGPVSRLPSVTGRTVVCVWRGVFMMTRLRVMSRFHLAVDHE